VALHLSQDARQDLDQIYSYGARQFGARAADTYAEGLLATFAAIAANPRLVRERTEVKPPVYLYPFRAHHIVYAIHGRDILVLRVLGHRQDWLNLL